MVEISRKSFIQRRRLEFIEWKLFWEGALNRKDIEKRFDLSTQQASADIKLYRDVAGRNVEYDTQGKSFRPTPRFTPKFLALSANRLLLQLRAYLMGAIARDDLWFRTVPPVDMAPDIARDIAPDKLKVVLLAIRDRREIEIEYQSLTNCRWRVIAPHALAFDGYRWHARAWSPDRQSFRDFVLSRIRGIREAGKASFDPDNDLEWSRLATLRLCPHPGLDPQQTEAIARDYAMTDGCRDVEVRLSMAYYFIKRMNLDLPDLPPTRAQIRLINLEDVKEAIAAARRDTEEILARSSDRVAFRTP